MAVGNTFGATALSSYGGFWLSFAIILTPGGFDIQAQLMTAGPNAFYDEFGLYLMVSRQFIFLGRFRMTADRTSPGLVHLHDLTRALHLALDRRLLLPLLLPRHGVHAPRHRLPPSRRRRYAQPTHHKSRRLLRAARGILGLV